MSKESKKKGYIDGMGTIRIDHMEPKRINAPVKGATYLQDDREPRLFLKVDKDGRFLVTNPGQEETVLGKLGHIGRDQAAIKALAIEEVEEYDFSGIGKEEAEKAEEVAQAESDKVEGEKQRLAQEEIDKNKTEDEKKAEADKVEEALKNEIEAIAEKEGLKLHGNLSSGKMQAALDAHRKKNGGKPKPVLT